MADVKWIKITTDIFDDEKILLIESMPAADSIISIWFKLLVLAGKQNRCGVLMMSNRIPYTDEMLATIFRRDVSTVRLALNTFEQFGMIEIIDGVITISNWEKHQNIEGMEKIREQTRIRVANYRQRQIAEDVTQCNVTVTQQNKNKKEKKIKNKYGEYGNVSLTQEEYQRLVEEFGEGKTKDAIDFLDQYIQEKGYKSKDSNLTLRRWVFKAVDERKEKNISKGDTNRTDYNSLVMNELLEGMNTYG